MRVRCEVCYHICDEQDRLRAVNPFNTEDTIVGCPKCQCVDAWATVCDVPACLKIVVAGFPTSSGYHHVCADHYHYYTTKETP